MNYAALHCHSYYSLLDGTMPPEQVAEAAHASGMTAAALVDRDTLAGAVQFYKKATALGLHAVIGSEVTLPDKSTLALLVENARGYRNLCRLITAGASDETLAEYSEGLICLAGPRSGVGRAIQKNKSPEPLLKKLEGWYGRNLALEISPHNDDDLRLARLFAELSRKRRILLATAAGTHYLSPEDRLRYDILQSMRTLTLLNQRHEEKLPAGRHHWHTQEEMARYFGALSHAMANTARIAARHNIDCDLSNTYFLDLPATPQVKRNKNSTWSARVCTS